MHSRRGGTIGRNPACEGPRDDRQGKAGTRRSSTCSAITALHQEGNRFASGQHPVTILFSCMWRARGCAEPPSLPPTPWKQFPTKSRRDADAQNWDAHACPTHCAYTYTVLSRLRLPLSASLLPDADSPRDHSHRIMNACLCNMSSMMFGRTAPVERAPRAAVCANNATKPARAISVKGKRDHSCRAPSHRWLGDELTRMAIAE